MSRSRFYQSGIANRGNAGIITRVRSTSWSVPIHPAITNDDFPREQARHGRRSVWTLVNS